MEPEKLPPLWALDMAAKAAGYIDWLGHHRAMLAAVEVSIIAHARTLAKYEKPPVDEAELKRRQDAREATAAFWDSQICRATADESRNGERDHDGTIQAAYIALCHRDGVTPTPVKEWGK